MDDTLECTMMILPIDLRIFWADHLMISLAALVPTFLNFGIVFMEMSRIEWCNALLLILVTKILIAWSTIIIALGTIILIRISISCSLIPEKPEIVFLVLFGTPCLTNSEALETVFLMWC